MLPVVTVVFIPSEKPCRSQRAPGAALQEDFPMIKNILDEKGVERALTRIAHEIIEKNGGIEDIVILGIPTRGVYLAKRINGILQNTEGIEPPVGSVDATLYRDDIGMKEEQPILKETDIPVPIDNKKVIIVDDVLFTGRTIRAAMNVIMDFGRPSSIQLAVLIDRGHRELPIRPDYVGKNVPTSIQEKVKVHLKETDGVDEVVVEADNEA